MVDWRGSTLQIVIAIIGSSLVVTALTTLTSYIIKPSLDLYVTVVDSTDPGNWYYDDAGAKHITIPEDNFTTYRIYLVNNGYSMAKDVRLTMTYPNASVINTEKVFENENLNITNKSSHSSVVTLSKLSPGIMIAVENSITGDLIDPYPDDPHPLDDFKQGEIFASSQYPVYSHLDPFSITATFDEGGSTYAPSAISSLYKELPYFNTDVLFFIIPIVTGPLLFGIAFRYKRNSVSKFASNILKDIETTIRRLGKVLDSRAILPFKQYDLYVENLDRVFDNYKDYKLIDDFYIGLKERASKITEMMKDGRLESNELRELKKINLFYLHLAESAFKKIDWKRFYKMDLILLIPAIILGSSFISMICDVVPFILLNSLNKSESFNPMFLIITFLARSLAAYYILRLILYSVQGVSITNRVLPLMFQAKYFGYCAAIMGFSSIYIVLFSIYAVNDIIFDYIWFGPSLPVILIIIDALRMSLLTWVTFRGGFNLSSALEKGSLKMVLG